mmetsp:Transcript_9624/g.19993  ORF Transcript_9624/g.19993 Transcript_9624/m.19993 type:complete len:300 (-) Transcript_9624:1426-2325(-)|eukprot:CAMPEP_0172455508 /NCGR_PEP_ID=MMETSP1065-20121228/12101_1 /TAXON_ID=265537 /ORGANISM="Amphiprora paludosa, Strain CCMP125" /LENGTH=299 /DNA_ID=CAMNT_0013207969 /DNA_START=80 /DNA_END=979 /DNA_ORIENTATION=-
MPQQVAGGKKKKGKAPAHQNKFAFRHNPKSKKTDQILSYPNVHVCRRCHEKIEWRKQYRKYKPRTQPGKCNLCSMKNVAAAYHTICTKCTTKSTKAKSLLATLSKERHDKWVERQQRKEQREQNEEDGESSDMDGEIEEQPAQSATLEGDKETPDAEQDEDEEPGDFYRICAVCVKEPALPASDDEDEEDDGVSRPLQKLSLRQRRTLERQQLQQQKSKTKSSKTAANATEENPAESNHENEHTDDNEGSDEELFDPDEEDDEDEDPFLKAVGGADKLLTGEAYQQKILMEQQKQAGLS